jgi:hypothetical protein
MSLRILIGLAFIAGCITSEPDISTTLPPVEVSGHVRIRIAADDGDVRVFTADVGQVEMVVESSGYDVEDELELSMTPHGDLVDIVAKTREDFRFFDFTIRSLQIDIRIPRDADVEIDTGDGSVEVDAVAGVLDVRTGDGSVTVRDASGDVFLQTGDGSIDARGLDGAVAASTGDGSVDLRGRFDAVMVETGDGDVEVTPLPGSQILAPWHLQTRDGSVTLGVPSDLGAHIDASANDGDVRSTLPLSQVSSSRLEGDVNGGGPAIVVRTGDGSIHLNQI